MVLAALVDTAGNVGLPLLFVLLAIETMGVPLPGETALIAMGIVASRGDTSIEAVIVVAIAGAVVGDNIGFLIGRRYGRLILQTEHGPWREHRRKLIAVAEPFFERHGPKAVFLGRWVAGLRICASWMAGAGGMRWPIFTFFNATGGALWAATVALLAYGLGHRADDIVRIGGFAGAAAAVVLAAVVWFVLRRRRARQDAAAADRSG